MRNLNRELENVEYDKLLEYGFNKIGNTYVFEKQICENYFKVIIEISNQNKISKVIDLSTKEEYILVDVKTSSGAFVGKIKEEYEFVLDDIFKFCSTSSVFKSKQARYIIKYIKEKYDDDLEYLWVKLPNNAIWRNKINNKWYGTLSVLSEKKLGINSDKIIDVISLRYQKNMVKDIVDNTKFFGGYHMNKDNWITLMLDESIGIEEIYRLIDNSYDLSLKK